MMCRVGEPHPQALEGARGVGVVRAAAQEYP